MCGNPFSPPKIESPAPAYVPPVPVAAEDDPDAQQRARAAKKRVQEQSLAAMNQNVYTSGTGVEGSASLGKKTLG